MNHQCVKPLIKSNKKRSNGGDRFLFYSHQWACSCLVHVSYQSIKYQLSFFSTKRIMKKVGINANDSLIIPIYWNERGHAELIYFGSIMRCKAASANHGGSPRMYWWVWTSGTVAVDWQTGLFCFFRGGIGWCAPTIDHTMDQTSQPPSEGICYAVLEQCWRGELKW